MPQAPVQRRQPRPVVLEAPEARRTDWDAAVKSFIRDCRRRNLSPSTTETYESILTNARTTGFRRDYDIRDAADFTAAQLKSLEGELLEAGLSPRSVMGYHRVLKTFASFCIDEGYGVDTRILGVTAPRQELHEPEVFSAAEEKRLLDAAETERDRILIEFMLTTGLRLREVERVTIDDIVESPGGAYVRVRQGKGRKDRIVPLDVGRARFGRKLIRYAERSRARDSQERALFLSTRGGRNGTGAPLTARGIQIVLYRLGQRSGLHVHPHKFRHTFATHALSDGVDIKALQLALGHTTPTMVLRYVQYQKDDLLEAWRRRT